MPVNTSELKKRTEYTFVCKKYGSTLTGRIGESKQYIERNGPYVTGIYNYKGRSTITFESLERTDLQWELKS